MLGRYGGECQSGRDAKNLKRIVDERLPVGRVDLTPARSVLLNEMPKEIRGREMTKERAEWVRAKAGEYFKEQNNSDSGKEASI